MKTDHSPVAAEDLRERIAPTPGAVHQRTTHEDYPNEDGFCIECGERWPCEVQRLRDFVAALAGDPGDLPARMAEAMRAARDQWVSPEGELAHPEVGEHFAAAALGVRDEHLAATLAENAQLRASLDEARGNADVYGQKMLRAERERDQARRELAETREKLAELRDLRVGLKSLTTESGAIEMSLHMAHDMMRACVAGFVKILDAEDAPNYVELAYSLRDDPERYTVTIQRPRGKTPAEVAGEANRRVREAEAERDRWKEAHDDLDSLVSEERKQHETTLAELDALKAAIETGSVARFVADVLSLVDDYSDRERSIIARLPFLATFDQVCFEKYGINTDQIAALAASESPGDAPAKPKHIGGRANAEDCPACTGDLPYPWICPGEPETPGDAETDYGHVPGCPSGSQFLGDDRACRCWPTGAARTPGDAEESDQWRRDEREIDGGFSGCEFPRLWPPRSAPETTPDAPKGGED